MSSFESIKKPFSLILLYTGLSAEARAYLSASQHTLPPSLSMVSASLADGQSFLNPQEQGKIAKSAGMGLGETERWAEKREKVGGVLRYVLIGA